SQLSTTSPFFFLLIPPPPRSTLFPYTTLFRSPRTTLNFSPSTSFTTRGKSAMVVPGAVAPTTKSLLRSSARLCTGAVCHTKATRSEEHTSELQSLRHLVCRLLLEKKKK